EAAIEAIAPGITQATESWCHGFVDEAGEQDGCKVEISEKAGHCICRDLEG
ncbi:unnamed protein product, partial [Chrysoparadoxa australica]